MKPNVFTKEDIMLKLNEKIKEMDVMKKTYEKEISYLKEENRKLKSQNIALDNKSSISKHILRLYASGNNVKNVYDIMTKKLNMDIQMDTIKMTIDNIDNLPEDLYKYFLECKKEFKDKVSIDKNFFTSMIYKKYEQLENSASMGLWLAEQEDDPKQIERWISILRGIYDSMANAYGKNGITSDQNKTIEDLMEGWNTGANVIATQQKTDKSEIKIKNIYNNIKEVG